MNSSKLSFLFNTVTSICLMLSVKANAQQSFNYWDPESDAGFLPGNQGWQTGLKGYYDRLPAEDEKIVRPAVWNLSRNTAGITISFETDADEIDIIYANEGMRQMNHMPAIGVSGVDMYSFAENGEWKWLSAKFTFGDTIRYRYAGINGGKKIAHSYVLFLPPYSGVKWMKIGVPEGNSFKPLLLLSKKHGFLLIGVFNLSDSRCKRSLISLR